MMWPLTLEAPSGTTSVCKHTWAAWAWVSLPRASRLRHHRHSHQDPPANATWTHIIHRHFVQNLMFQTIFSFAHHQSAVLVPGGGHLLQHREKPGLLAVERGAQPPRPGRHGPGSQWPTRGRSSRSCHVAWPFPLDTARTEHGAAIHCSGDRGLGATMVGDNL